MSFLALLTLLTLVLLLAYTAADAATLSFRRCKACGHIQAIHDRKAAWGQGYRYSCQRCNCEASW